MEGGEIRFWDIFGCLYVEYINMDKENSDILIKFVDVNVSIVWEVFFFIWMLFIVDFVSKMRLCYLIKIKGVIIKYFIFLWYLMDFTNVSLF